MNRREREYEQRRNEILAAARKLFLKKGFDAVSIKDIALEAEFSRFTIYQYFKSKMDILLPVFSADYNKHIKKYKEIINKLDTNRAKLKAYGRHYYNFFAETPDYHQLITQYHKHRMDNEILSERNLQIRQDSSKDSIEVFKSIFEEGINSGEFRSDLDVMLCIAFFQKCVFAMVHQYVFTPDLSLERLDTEMDYLLRAFEK